MLFDMGGSPGELSLEGEIKRQVTASIINWEYSVPISTTVGIIDLVDLLVALCEFARCSGSPCCYQLHRAMLSAIGYFLLHAMLQRRDHDWIIDLLLP